MMAKIKEVDNNNSETGPSRDTNGVTEVPDYDTCFINELYFVSAHDRKHPEQLESINDTYITDQLDNTIIFDSLDIDINRGIVEQDKTSRDHNSVVVDSLLKKMQLEVERCNTVNRQLESHSLHFGVASGCQRVYGGRQSSNHYLA
ncbi:hypothetical protein Tco_0908267 [Tanacetum coccineum]|uniref:Uncharacterized protein n=1 Tax=Tanacetum coccineum TaxID=301880 RepID=A0ABQ5CPG1_9ASTR